jgi:hypothetical protein
MRKRTPVAGELRHGEYFIPDIIGYVNDDGMKVFRDGLGVRQNFQLS